MALIKCEDLCLGYDGREIVHGLNFSVSAGDCLCVVGENGSGKTTLMKTLLGLREPLSWRVVFGDGLRKNEIGYLPQQTAVQRDFPATVSEIVLSGCQCRGRFGFFYSKDDRALAAENMEKLGITSLAGRCYRELSGGQQQRVLLARALCATEKMLLLDEPASGLDPRVTESMYALIDRLHGEGIAVIMISHDIAAALARATHILHIGGDVFFGTRDEYLESDVYAGFAPRDCGGDGGNAEDVEERGERD